MTAAGPARRFTPPDRRPARSTQQGRATRRRRVRRTLRRLPPLTHYLAQIKDPRSPRGRRHALGSILTLLIVGLLCQQNGYRAAALWARACSPAFKRRLGFTEHDTPAPSTFCEVLKVLPWKEVSTQLRAWSQAVLQALGQADVGELNAVSLDGKRLRGAAAAGAEIAHYLALVVHGLALTLGEQAVAQGQGELTVTEKFLEEVLAAGWVVTADAQFTQRSVTKQILERGADYVLMAKGNQPKLAQAIADVLGPTGATRDQRRATMEVERRGRRIANRFLVAVTVDPEDTGTFVEWPGVQQVFCVRRSYYHPTTRKETDQLVYGLTSLPPEQADPERLLRLTRGHWTIETGNFWVRDVVLGEDASRMGYGKVAMAMTILRGVAITSIKAAGYAGVTEGRRELSAQPNRALALVGA